MPLVRTVQRSAGSARRLPIRPLPRQQMLSHPARAVLLAFSGMVALGTGLLMLPSATQAGGAAPFRVALFTSASASSVTGLGVVDTAGYWSTFGECVLMGLMQLGGLGIMTASALLGLVVARRLGLRSRMLVETEAARLDLGTVRRLLVSVLRISLTIEALAWLAVTSRLALHYDEPAGRAAYLALFHSVSAYNNGGFALWPDGLTRFGSDPLLLGPLGAAFVLGAIGYPVMLELLRSRRPITWSVHTRLTLIVFAGLAVVGPIVVLTGEWYNAATLGAIEGAGGRVTAGTFTGLSAISAGFNVFDFGAADPGTLLWTDVLMFIGGGSGGTSGGIKVTTVAVLALAAVAEIRGDDDITVFGRRLTASTMRQALTVTMLSLATVAVGTLLLLEITDVDADAGLFEVVSAFSSTGLSTGVTPSLPPAAQYLLTALMVIGRVGPVTAATALALRSSRRLYRYPETRPLVG